MKSRCIPSPLYPSVTIGLPVYNGGEFLYQALDSLVLQEYPNLEIFVSDNCSTDGSWEVIRQYASKDDRFRIHQHSSNLGAAKNFTYVLEQTDAEFFMWTSHDDVWSGNFVASAVSTLQACPEAVMANAPTILINEHNQPITFPTRPDLCDLAGTSLSQRMQELAKRVGWSIYGLIRRDPLIRTSALLDPEIMCDVLLSYELAAVGSFRLIDDTKFKYRFVAKNPATTAGNLGLSAERTFKPFSRLFKKCLLVIRTAPAPQAERQRTINAFFTTCANHPEWWGSLSRENEWPPDADLTIRMDRLNTLAKS